MKIGLLGLGTVGCGVVDVFQRHQRKYQSLVGRPLELTHIFARSIEKAQHLDLSSYTITSDIEKMYQAELDIVIEVMGGVDFSKTVIEQFIQRGVHVVTANKDLLALHVDGLSQSANEHGVSLMYEASVAGGIPIVNTLEVALASNQIVSVMGILNGTTNYMLDQMTRKGLSYQEALALATEKGYAESNPTNDVDGFDAQRKIALLSRLAYDTIVPLQQVSVSGIRDLELEDIYFAEAINAVVKLLGTSERMNEAVSIQVAPVMVDSSHPLAHVHDANNAIFVKGDAVGEMMLLGPGAGSHETASAIISDVLQVAKRTVHTNYIPTQSYDIVSNTRVQPYYVRLTQDCEWIQYFERASEDGLQGITKPLSVEQVAHLQQDDNVSVCIQYLTTAQEG